MRADGTDSRRSQISLANTQRSASRQLIDDREVRKVGGWVVGNPQHDQSAVVVRCSARAAVAIRCSQDLFGDFASRIFLRNSGKKSRQPFRTKLFRSVMLRFQDAD